MSVKRVETSCFLFLVIYDILLYITLFRNYISLNNYNPWLVVWKKLLYCWKPRRGGRSAYWLEGNKLKHVDECRIDQNITTQASISKPRNQSLMKSVKINRRSPFSFDFQRPLISMVACLKLIYNLERERFSFSSLYFRSGNFTSSVEKRFFI